MNEKVILEELSTVLRHEVAAHLVDEIIYKVQSPLHLMFHLSPMQLYFFGRLNYPFDFYVSRPIPFQ
jgi:hypothetical protein